MGPPAGDAPSIILLPELSVGPADIANVRALINVARANTLVICGIGHMAAADVDQVEASAHLCGEPIGGHYANCALIGCGGSNQVFLQPKVVASREELDCHWAGRVVRCFGGGFFSFVVFICSEMLDRAQARTTIREVFDRLAEANQQPPVVFWLQHNPKPRSVDFSQSLEVLSHVERPTAFVAGSRSGCLPRLENFAVSGALFKKAALARHFNVLTRQFHYVEPVSESTVLSRVVLLRYDVDVNLVETALASAIEDGDRTPRSQLFGSVRPLVLQDGTLIDSDDNIHLGDIIRRSRDTAAATDATQTARINALAEQLVGLGTPRFQDFLDRAIVPRPQDEHRRHAAGQQHAQGDYSCDCWAHRRCIDLLCDDADAAAPVAHVLLALARIAAQGLNVSLIPLSDSPANVRLSSASGQFDLCVVYPFNFDADATEMAIRGGGRPRVSEPGYIVLGTSGRAGRPALAQISQAVARPVAPLQAAVATEPLLRAVYNDELTASETAGTLSQLLQQRFG